MTASTSPASADARSTDGTTIGYESVGMGPDVVIVHGAMQSSASHRDLARLLAGSYRVHLMDRRGRCASGAYPKNLSTAIEVDDLRAVLVATGARRVFGVSSGGLIAARAALVDPTIERLALFEPPLSMEGSMRLELAPRMEDAFARGDIPTAMGVAMKVAEMGPPWMFGLPVPVLAILSRGMLRSDAVRDLAEALPADFQVVRENADRGVDFSAIATPTLLIDGTATRPYLREAVSALTGIIPGARHVELPGQMHGVTQNRAERGHPDLIAPLLQEFFA